MRNNKKSKTNAEIVQAEVVDSSVLNTPRTMVYGEGETGDDGGGSSSEPQDVNVDVTVDIPLDDTNGKLSDIGDVITQQSEHIEDLTKLIKKQNIQNKFLCSVLLTFIWHRLALDIRNRTQFEKYLDIEKTDLKKMLIDMGELVDEFSDDDD